MYQTYNLWQKRRLNDQQQTIGLSSVQFYYCLDINIPVYYMAQTFTLWLVYLVPYEELNKNSISYGVSTLELYGFYLPSRICIVSYTIQILASIFSTFESFWNFRKQIGQKRNLYWKKWNTRVAWVGYFIWKHL